MDRPTAPRFENCCYYKSGRLAPNLADSGAALARVFGKPEVRPFLTPWRLLPTAHPESERVTWIVGLFPTAIGDTGTTTMRAGGAWGTKYASPVPT